MRDVHVTSVDLCVNGMVTEEKLLLQVRVCYLLFTPQMSTDLVRDGFCLGEQCLHPFHGINIAGPRKERGRGGGQVRRVVLGSCMLLCNPKMSPLGITQPERQENQQQPDDGHGGASAAHGNGDEVLGGR